MLRAGAPREEGGYESLLASVFNRRKEKPSDREQRQQIVGVRSPVLLHLVIEGNLNCHNVRHFGHSRSDSFDAGALRWDR